MTSFITRYCNKQLISVLILLFAVLSLSAQENKPLRRPISPEQPMYLVHIDTWNYADPQKIIDLIPEDIRPYVVMNISLSISHSVSTSRFQVAEYGYEIAKSWLRTCAQNQMWAIVQHSSGGFAQFSDFDLSVYEEFYNDYPNLIGFNYAEQFWGYDDASDPLSPKWTDRIAHFANMLELSNRYGGYLLVSWCGNQWSPSINPIGMLKRNPAFVEACEKYTQNYILFEKYTQQAYQSDMESLTLGAFLSGYSGHYGIRYDDTGWTDINGEHNNFTMATAGAVHLEHIMLTGQTIIDGPELIWTQCFRETNRKPTTDGYTMRDWETFPQFINVTVDIFRKILDGTVRIPTREEVIDRTKFVVVNDVNSGSSDDIYSSPASLFEGLYRMDGDGNLQNNKSFFKKTGRYPTIPTVFRLDEEADQSFNFKVNKSDYSTRWVTIGAKVEEFNNIFPAEYTGDLYAGRHENGWVIYNPFKTGQTASASIPFKYNTCDSTEITFSQYTAAVMKEYSDKLTFYLSNHDNVLYTGRKTNIIKIYGSTTEPQYSVEDRGDHQGNIATGNWSDGVFTLTIQHNGPVDVTINCSGAATERLTAFTPSNIVEPVKPPLYAGPRQYEAECFDYKNISSVTTGGYNGTIRNYTGQGYLRVGTSSLAAVRRTVNALRKGTYQLVTRYSVSTGDVNSLDLYVNGVKVATPVFTRTANASTWNNNIQAVELNAGDNVIELKANRTGSYSIVLDNIIITQGNENNLYHFENDEAGTIATTPPAELITILSGTAGVVEYTDADGLKSNGFRAYSPGTLNETGVASLDMFNSMSENYSVVWKEQYNTPGASKGVLLRGTGEDGSCPYAQGMKQGYLFVVRNNEDNTISLKTYLADEAGLTLRSEVTTAFKVMPGQPAWYRAKAFNDKFVFEYSSDSINWMGASATSFTDATYPKGSTQLVWGLGAGNIDWVTDNIAYLSETLIVSRMSLEGFRYAQGRGPAVNQSFTINGNALSGDIEIQSTSQFEISLDSENGFENYLVIPAVDGTILPTTVYVRMKQGLAVEMYSGYLSVVSGVIEVHSIELTGEVTPQATMLRYDFTKDVASTMAATPPAVDVSIAQGNSATAGVVSYTDASQVTSNMFKPYGNGQRNATGVVNLDLFPDNATDYSVTWKQHIASPGTEYKIGMLLRGDTQNYGTATTGYVQGMMQGYLFIVYHSASGSQFRIYRSTETYNSLNILVNAGVGSLLPAAGQPVWYRASVSGTTSVALSFEYSLDGITWNKGASATDNTPPTFTSGATQIVWGLAAAAVSFYIDDISFNGLHLDSGTLPENISLSTSMLEGFTYNQGNGPSQSQSFMVWGNDLSGDILVNAPSGYEVSTEAETGYVSSLSLADNNGAIGETTVYVRLISGLRSGSYNGDLLISSEGSLSMVVDLRGVVNQSTSVGGQPLVPATVIATEYYSVTGQKLERIDGLHGIFIVKKFMSDGTVSTTKVLNLGRGRY